MSQRYVWPLSTAAGRWSGFGPYYAMFPVSFAKEMVERYSPVGGEILDPFCGRGTVPFVSKVLGRASLGVDVNPVGWTFASVKTNPSQSAEALYRRLEAVARSVEPEDRKADNSFQELAWSPSVLGFLKAARRHLKWRSSQVDRTLMGFLLVYLHAKAGGGLSNQMRQSKAMAPDYAVRWWTERSMKPPELNPKEYFKERVAWRYSRGVISGPRAEIALGDSRRLLDIPKQERFDLLITSPPYCGVTNYKYDNWIRLWLLGGPPLPEWDTEQRYADPTRYKASLAQIFCKAVRLLKDTAVVCVRTDTRAFTLRTTIQILLPLLPDHTFFIRQERPKRTQTALYGDYDSKPGETDVLALPAGIQPLQGFSELQNAEMGTVTL